MTLSIRLHCPRCRGRLVAASALELRCSSCEQAVVITDGIADFATDANAEPCSGVTQEHGVLASDLPARIKRAADDRWPDHLGTIIELGCGLGHMTHALAAGERIRDLIVLDSDRNRLLACRQHLRDEGMALDSGPTVVFAAAGAAQNIVRDAVADTVIGTAVLARTAGPRSFLIDVHRILKPGGRALFIVPNRRYWQAICLAMTEALVQRHANEGKWPREAWPVMTKLARIRQMMLHPGTVAHPDDLHPFDADAVEYLGAETGFATTDVIPLSPDAAGADTIERFCLEAGTPEGFAREVGCLGAVAGRRFFGLLSDRDAAAYSLVWLTKAPGPAVRFQKPRPPVPPMVYPAPDIALGGVPPHWSIELLGWQTPDGIMVRIGGWCLGNVDVLAVRVTLDDVGRDAPACRYRPDVQEVMNPQRLYHPVNALFSGLDGELLFPGLQAGDDSCRLQIDIVLTGGVTLSGPTPDRLVLNEPMVIAH